MGNHPHRFQSLRLILGLVLAYALAVGPLLGGLALAAAPAGHGDLCLHLGAAAPQESGDSQTGGSGYDCCTFSCRISAASAPALVAGMALPLPVLANGVLLATPRLSALDEAQCRSSFARGPPAFA